MYEEDHPVTYAFGDPYRTLLFFLLSRDMTYHRTVWALEALVDEFYIAIDEVHKVSEDVVK